jgi:hypothetical protein
MGANSAGEKILAKVTPTKSDATRAKFWEIITGDFGAPRGLERASFLLFLLMVKTKTGWQNLQMTKNSVARPIRVG